MKKLNVILSALLIIILTGFVQNLFAQSAITSGYTAKSNVIQAENSINTYKILTLKGTLDTNTVNNTGVGLVDSLWFGPFNVSLFNDSASVNYLTAVLSGGTASTQKISAEVWGSPLSDGTYYKYATWMNADSATTEIRHNNLGFTGFAPPFIKILVFQGAANTVTTFDIKAVLKRKSIQ